MNTSGFQFRNILFQFRAKLAEDVPLLKLFVPELKPDLDASVYFCLPSKLSNTYNEDKQPSQTDDIQPDEVQILIDQRMTYLIEREKKEADRIKSVSNAGNRTCFPNYGLSRIKNLLGRTRNKND